MNVHIGNEQWDMSTGQRIVGTERRLSVLTWYERSEVLKPLPHRGVSVHVDHLASQALGDGRGVKLASRCFAKGPPGAFVVMPRRGVLDQPWFDAAVFQLWFIWDMRMTQMSQEEIHTSGHHHHISNLLQ